MNEALSPPGPGGDTGGPSLTPAEIAVLLETAREYVLRAVGLELDLTPETLPILDHYGALVRESARERPELVALVAPPIAAYFGELVCARLNGFWHGAAGAPDEWRVCGRAAVVSFNPLGVVSDVLHRGADHDGPSGELSLLPEHRDAVAHRMAALPAVREDEYYMLATRFEVIELVFDEVARQMQLRGGERVWLEWEDYAALFGGGGGRA